MKTYLRIALAVIAFCVALYATHFVLASAFCALGAWSATAPKEEPEEIGSGENGGKES